MPEEKMKEAAKKLLVCYDNGGFQDDDLIHRLFEELRESLSPPTTRSAYPRCL